MFNKFFETRKAKRNFCEFNSGKEWALREFYINGRSIKDIEGMLDAASVDFGPFDRGAVEIMRSIQQDIDNIASLTRYKESTEGLWATDRPDLVGDPKNILFRLEYTELKQ